MEGKEAAIIQLELKYCERCGGLFLRRLEVGEVYCANCAEQMVDPRWMRRAKIRPRLGLNSDGRRLLEVIKPVSTEGGNA